jgi:SAM-dependent methyltransferase
MYPRFYSGILIQIIIVLALAWILVMLYKKWMPKKEGFVQREKFIVKREQEGNDMFYAEVYDQLHVPEKRVPFELKTILSLTQASDASLFLDVGSSTGYLVHELTLLGYDAYGIDKSRDMVEYSEKKYPEILVKHGDIYDAMNYETNTFSHILCMDSTIYHLKDKVSFFRNCFGWMRPGGHLVVHLVEPKKMNAKLPVDTSNKPMFLKENQTVDSIIDFNEFKYKVSYKLDGSGTMATMTETFFDALSGNIRQNEKTMYYTPLQDILSIANYTGFIPEGKVDMSEANGDEHQYIYVFVRP